jgi:hypothetical protein
MPATQTLKAPHAPFFSDRFRAGAGRAWKIFLINREISALKQARHHLYDDTAFDDRFRALVAERAAL